MNSRSTFAIAAALLLVGCSTPAISLAPAPTAYVSGGKQDTDLSGNARITMDVGADGVSAPFMVTTGAYDIEVSVDSGKGGCSFALLLTTAKDGPVLKSTVALVNASGGVASDVWSMIAGTYLLQEDETGLLNCRRSFQATITAKN